MYTVNVRLTKKGTQKTVESLPVPPGKCFNSVGFPEEIAQKNRLSYGIFEEKLNLYGNKPIAQRYSQIQV